MQTWAELKRNAEMLKVHETTLWRVKKGKHALIRSTRLLQKLIDAGHYIHGLKIKGDEFQKLYEKLGQPPLENFAKIIGAPSSSRASEILHGKYKNLNSAEYLAAILLQKSTAEIARIKKLFEEVQ